MHCRLHSKTMPDCKSRELDGRATALVPVRVPNLDEARRGMEIEGGCHASEDGSDRTRDSSRAGRQTNSR